MFCFFVEVVLVLTVHHSDRNMPGAPVNISTDDPFLQKIVLNATYAYNNESNDVYLYRPATIIRAQEQVTSSADIIWLSPCAAHRWCLFFFSPRFRLLRVSSTS